MAENQSILGASANDERLTPFVWTALIWGVLATALAYFLGGTVPGATVAWTLGLWALCGLDLLALAKALRLFLGLSQVPAERKAPYLFQTLFWTGAKVACLGSFAWVLIRADGAPSTGILLGMATLIVVPIAGGFWWSHQAVRP